MKCEHILEDTGAWGQTTYTYCDRPLGRIIHGVGYCANHAVENDRRERINNLIEKIDAHRPQS
jgi:hypothetical protein